MEFKANSGVWGTMFGVPCVVADNFLKLATGQQLKVLLYLLRCSGRSCSVEEIAANTGVLPQEAADAVLFWQQVNVLSAQSPQSAAEMPSPVLTSPIMSPPPSDPVQPVINTAAEIPQAVEKQDISTKQRRSLSASEISQFLQDSDDIAELFKIAENALGLLNHTKQDSIIWMYDYLGLKKEVIITLLFYCAGIEKTDPRYIETIAKSWAENEINTLSAAQDEVQKMTDSRSFTGKIMKIFEMQRRPTTKQAELISAWQSEGFSIELISYAYEKTIENINKLNFDYINKILLSWKNNGFATIKDVQNSENDFRKKKNSSNSGVPSDIDKYNVVINKF